MLTAGANECGLKYCITVKYVEFILCRKKKHVCWPGVLVGRCSSSSSSTSSLAISRAPRPERDGEDAGGCKTVGYEGSGMGAGCVPL